VVNQVTKARAAELEEQQGFKPGRKQLKELKEQVTEELLPRAFSIRRDTRVWIDPVNGWLAIDAAGTAKADEVRGMLFKAIDPLPVANLQVNLSPVRHDRMAGHRHRAGRLHARPGNRAPATRARQPSATVRHRHAAGPLRRHIAAGKRCTRLAMTWNDRVSFVLTEALASSA
jgi:recombination associated protein RdgC